MAERGRKLVLIDAVLLGDLLTSDGAFRVAVDRSLIPGDAEVMNVSWDASRLALAIVLESAAWPPVSLTARLEVIEPRALIVTKAPRRRGDWQVFAEVADWLTAGPTGAQILEAELPT